jgi:hypothetical protein
VSHQHTWSRDTPLIYNRIIRHWTFSPENRPTGCAF